MWIDDDGTVSSMWVSGSFRLLAVAGPLGPLDR